jgi:TonB family protein
MMTVTIVAMEEIFMRRILATSLMLPSLLLPAVAKASTPVNDASAPTPIRVSTGVIFPELLDSSDVTIPEPFAQQPVPGDAQVGVRFTVDLKGHPQNIQITKSLNPLWDARVIDAVREFRYRPGTVSNQPVAFDMNLTINIAH